MTESEYQATASLERLFGRLQVRWKTKALAAEYGLPETCMLPPDPVPSRDDGLWADDLRSAVAHREELAQFRMEERYRFSIPTFTAPRPSAQYSFVV